MRGLADRVAGSRVGAKQLVGRAACPVRQPVSSSSRDLPATAVHPGQVEAELHCLLHDREAELLGPGLARRSVDQPLDEQAFAARRGDGDLAEQRGREATAPPGRVDRHLDPGEVGVLVADKVQVGHRGYLAAR